MIQKIKNWFSSNKEERIERCHLDSKLLFRLERQQFITISGWYHDSVGEKTPRLSIFFDEKSKRSLPLNTARPDVQEALGATKYMNGFNVTIPVIDAVVCLDIVNEKTKKCLVSLNVSELSMTEMPASIIRSTRWLNKTPRKLRISLSKKYQGDDYMVGSPTNHEFMYNLLKYHSRPNSHRNGYNIFSHVSGAFGIAEAGRALIDFHIDQGESISLFDYFVPQHPSISQVEEARYTSLYYQPFQYHTNLFLIDVHAALQARDAVPELFLNKRNITSFWWEFETGFEDTLPALNQFDEVLVFSDFIHGILSNIPNREFKITKVRYPFYNKWTLDNGTPASVSKYKLEGKFCFFFNFDFHSSFNRKNPMSSLEAFHREFVSEENVIFIYKTNNSSHHNDKYIEFSNAIEKLNLTDRVIVLQESLTKNEFMSTLNKMNCYVSLHRGEGLGLGILEALALNKPVVATNYGGNTEYMNHPLAHPVNYTLVDCDDDFPVYKNVKQWAQPDIDHAARLMRSVYEEFQNEK